MKNPTQEEIVLAQTKPNYQVETIHHSTESTWDIYQVETILQSTESTWDIKCTFHVANTVQLRPTCQNKNFQSHYLKIFLTKN